MRRIRPRTIVSVVAAALMVVGLYCAIRSGEVGTLTGDETVREERVVSPTSRGALEDAAGDDDTLDDYVDDDSADDDDSAYGDYSLEDLQYSEVDSLEDQCFIEYGQFTILHDDFLETVDDYVTKPIGPDLTLDMSCRYMGLFSLYSKGFLGQPEEDNTPECNEYRDKAQKMMDDLKDEFSDPELYTSDQMRMIYGALIIGRNFADDPSNTQVCRMFEQEE